MKFGQILILTTIIITSTLISGCSKYKFYRIAIDNERQLADLVIKEAEISIGDIVYLENHADKSLILDEKLSQNQIPMNDREVILMVHGFTGDKDHWVRLAEKLSADYRILIPDLPGHGDSISDFTDSYTIENQAIWLSEFTETLKIENFHIVGNSIGGAIALKLTHLFPEKVTSLTLLNCSGIEKNESEFTEELRKGNNRLIIRSVTEFKPLIDFVMEQKPYIPDAIYEVLAEKKVARNLLDQKIFKDILTDVNKIELILPEIKKPTLIIWGKKDRVNHVDNAEEFYTRITGSQKIILKDIGHLPMLEAPDKISSHFASFLLSVKRHY